LVECSGARWESLGVNEIHDQSGTVKVVLRGGFRIGQLDKMIEAIRPLCLLTEPTPFQLDLSGLAFASPASLATLVASVLDGLDRGVIAPGTYVPPRNRLVARYLDRIDFNRLLTGADISSEHNRRPPAGFRPVQGFTCEADLDELAESLAMAATEAMAVTGRDRLAVSIAIAEIAKNVLDHAESGVGGFAIAQRSRSRKEFEIAVADAGIGISGSLRKNLAYADVATDSDAITKALALGVTASPGDNNRGIGLSAIRELLQENGGTLLIRSGSGAVEHGPSTFAADRLVPLQGTLVALRMRTDRPFEFELFEQLAAGGAQETLQAVRS
jgi:anti-sigma regulatory factor (Ser/Thr protein kinase)